jgi:flagellar protein FlbD
MRGLRRGNPAKAFGGKALISVHRLNKEEFLVNCDLIEFVEETPDTVISMTSGRKLVISETCDEIKKLIIEYKRQIYCGDFKQLSR